MKTVTVNGKKYSMQEIETNCTPVEMAVKPGDRVKHENGDEYIVALIDCDTIRLIGLRDGNRWSDHSLFAGDEDEFEFIPRQTT